MAKGDTFEKKKAKSAIKQYFDSILVYLDGTQMFFLLLSVPFIIIAPYCLKNIYEIVEETKRNNPEYVGPKWSDFLLLFITLPSIALGKYIIKMMFSEFYDSRMSSKYQGEIRRLKIEKGCENIFKTLYFTGISLYGYYAVLVKLPFESPVFGNGTWHNYFIGYPYTVFLPATTYYCFLNLSYHMESSIYMLMYPRNDFYEMFCHHTMTLLIISIAYITNYNNIAIPFMLVIDNADIFVGMVRICIDITDSKLLLFSMYVVLMSSWGYTRLVIFPYEIIWKASINTIQYAEGRLTPHYFMTAMLSVLGILNFYWYALLIRMGYRFFSGITGPIDLQKNDGDTVEKKQKIQ